MRAHRCDASCAYVTDQKSAASGDRQLASAPTTHPHGGITYIIYYMYVRIGGGELRKWCRNEFCARRVFRSFGIQDGVCSITIIIIYRCMSARGWACVSCSRYDLAKTV